MTLKNKIKINSNDKLIRLINSDSPRCSLKFYQILIKRMLFFVFPDELDCFRFFIDEIQLQGNIALLQRATIRRFPRKAIRKMARG